MFNDDRGFDRQRRNVIFSSAILILVIIATNPGENDLSRIVVLGLDLKFKPCLVGFLWSCMIFYFMVRLYQMPLQDSRDPRSLWSHAFTLKLLMTASLSSRHKALMRERMKGFLEDHPQYEESEVKMKLIEWGPHPPDPQTGSITYWPIFEYKAGTLGDAIQLRSSEGVTIKRYGLVWNVAILRTFLSLSIRTEYFTEYLLPYMLALLAILLEAIRYNACVSICN